MSVSFLVESSRRPHDLPQPALLLLAPKNDVDSSPREGADLGPGQVEVLHHEGVLVGERASKDANVVGLVVCQPFVFVSRCLFLIPSPGCPREWEAWFKDEEKVTRVKTR